jgi:homoserine acetyltransferase
MGGMQTLQWGVSHPDFMDSLVAMVPLARTPAWTVTVLEATRKAIMLDPAWKHGDYEAPPGPNATRCAGRTRSRLQWRARRELCDRSPRTVDGGCTAR